MESLTKLLFDFDKLPARLVLIIAILSGSILFLPDKLLSILKLQDFNTNHGQWVGISFISSTAFLMVSLVTTIQRRAEKKKWNKGIENEIRNNLKSLDPFEKSILREFYIVGSTLNLPMSNPQVIGLQDKRIIRLAQSNLGGSYVVSGNFELSYMLTGYAKTLIEGDISLIDLPSQPIDESQKRNLIENRPPWTKNYWG